MVAPIASFIPGLNPVVTLAAAGLKAVDGLTDKPPNFGKMFEGAMGLIPGGALTKALGPLGQGTAGQFAQQLLGAAAGEKGGGTGGLLGDVLGKALGNSAIGGPDTFLGGLATKMFGELAGKLQSSAFESQLTDVISKLTGSKAGDILSADAVLKALTSPTGNMVDRLIDGAVQQVPEYVLRPEYLKLFENAISSTVADADRSSSRFEERQRPVIDL
ncbi:MAG: hypothetical protein JNK82_17260 [Myxococcaceae bacterium]|nr:hypothetical protein [Myxococcaceae bacterium]